MNITSTPIISIIVPIYNAEEYISDCMDSIYSQDVNINSFEVICVDDCSNDNSNKILKDYQNTFRNVYVVTHDRNKKAGGARNTGLLKARGEYIWYIDVDDKLTRGALRQIIQLCTSNRLDILFFNYESVSVNKVDRNIVFDDLCNVQSGTEFLLKQFGDKLIYYMFGFVWRVIFRREMLIENNILFPEDLLYGEDTTYILDASIYASRVMGCSDVFYSYTEGNLSVSYQLTHDMKGDRIYESVFSAGKCIFDMLNKIDSSNHHFSSAIKVGLPYFFNRLFYRLLKTTKNERNQFFAILRENRYDNIQLCQYMDTKNRMIITFPFMAKIVLNFLSKLYSLKTKI